MKKSLVLIALALATGTAVVAQVRVEMQPPKKDAPDSKPSLFVFRDDQGRIARPTDAQLKAINESLAKLDGPKLSLIPIDRLVPNGKQPVTIEPAPGAAAPDGVISVKPPTTFTTTATIQPDGSVRIECVDPSGQNTTTSSECAP